MGAFKGIKQGLTEAVAHAKGKQAESTNTSLTQSRWRVCVGAWD